MARPPPSPEMERRIPRQQRAQESCAAIFAATAQVLAREGMAGLSTNHIAARAGVSVGTLYQYFPNKQAVLLAMGRRDIATLRQALASANGAEVLPRLLACVRDWHGSRLVLRETVFSPPLHDELAAAVATATAPLVGPEASAARHFVLARAILGVVRGAVLEESAPLPEALEPELRALVRGYLVPAAQWLRISGSS